MTDRTSFIGKRGNGNSSPEQKLNRECILLAKESGYKPPFHSYNK